MKKLQIYKEVELVYKWKLGDILPSTEVIYIAPLLILITKKLDLQPQLRNNEIN